MLSTREVTADVVERGMSIYKNEIAPQLTDADDGRYIAVDVKSSEWEIGETESVSEVLRARIPDADIFLWRHPESPRGFVRWFPPGMMKRLGIPSGILDEAME